MRRGLLLLLAACGGPTARPIAAPGNEATIEPDALPYAAIFEDGKRWTFDVATETYDGGEDYSGEAVVECWVETVETDGDFTTAEIACGQAPMSGAPFVGMFTMGPGGFWEGGPEEASSSPPAIAAVPEAYQHEDEQGEDNGGGVDGVQLTHEGDAWCVRTYWTGGDGGGRAYCVQAGVGFAGGDTSFDGGSSYSAEYKVR